MSGILKDHRTRDIRPIKDIKYFYIATDRVMSGWGMAPGKSYVAYPAPADWQTCDRLERWMQQRGDFRRVRTASRLPRMQDGDHTSLYDVPEFLTD